MVKISHLQIIHDLKSYRNACRVVKQLENYTSVSFHNKSKVIYLNKAGRELIGSINEIKKTSLTDHMLYCNDAYIILNCPSDWRREESFEIEQQALSSLEIKINGLSRKAITTKKVIADATFERNGYLHLIEIDNTRKMIDNKKKIETYSELFKQKRDKVLKLNIFTTTNDRKYKFEKLLTANKLRGEVQVFRK